jgi:hypothetical protein
MPGWRSCKPCCGPNKPAKLVTYLIFQLLGGLRFFLYKPRGRCSWPRKPTGARRASLLLPRRGTGWRFRGRISGSHSGRAGPGAGSRPSRAGHCPRCLRPTSAARLPAGASHGVALPVGVWGRLPGPGGRSRLGVVVVARGSSRAVFCLVGLALGLGRCPSPPAASSVDSA